MQRIVIAIHYDGISQNNYFYVVSCTERSTEMQFPILGDDCFDAHGLCCVDAHDPIIVHYCEKCRATPEHHPTANHLCQLG